MEREVCERPDALDSGYYAKVADEIFSSHDRLEIGVDLAGRQEIGLEPSQPVVDQDSISLDENSVILLTGGAAGITGEISLELARRYRCQLVLVGRTKVNQVESSDIAGLETAFEIRKHLIAVSRGGDSKAVPMQIERQVRETLKQRAIRKSIGRMRQLGATVSYFSLDVCDTPRLQSLLDEVYDRFGRIDGVIHGAGLIEDRLLQAKSESSFRRVFDTKVMSAEILASRLNPATLKFLVFFSSIAARFGNAGQTDYAAANEHLNKLAAVLNSRWPGRVVSMNWGPWDSGMVSEEVKRKFQEQGIELIAPRAGVQAFFDELSATRRAAEVVMTCSIDALARQAGVPIIHRASSETPT